MMTTVKLPEFDPDNIQMYIDELEMWHEVSEVDKNKQAFMVWMSLPKNHTSKIKELIHESIGKEGLKKDDGMDKLIDTMKKCFGQETGIEPYNHPQQLVQPQQVQPAQHPGYNPSPNHQNAPTQAQQPMQAMSIAYNTGCTINNIAAGGSIGTQNNYAAINSNIGHMGPTTIINMTIKDVSKELGINEVDSEKFGDFLGEEKDNQEYLQKLVSLNKEHKFELPSVSKMMSSTCLIHYMGPHGGKWHGTGFLSTLPNFEGAVLLSAGHNFEDGGPPTKGKLLKDFENFHLMFNNEHGLNASNRNDDKKGTVIHKTLTDFMGFFTHTTLVLCCKGMQLVKHGNKKLIERKLENSHLDYFALILHDTDARQKLENQNLDFLEAASMEELKKSGDPVFIFGHPGLKFCPCCKRSSYCTCQRRDVCVCKKDCNCGSSTPTCPCVEDPHPDISNPVPCNHSSCSCRHPLRFSYAMSKKEKIDDRIHYYLDTLGGNSGSPITGAKYKAKGIHIASGSKSENKAQSLRAVIKDLQSLDIFKEDLEKCTFHSDFDSSADNDSLTPQNSGDDCKVQ